MSNLIGGSRKVSIMKSFSWRIIATATTTLLAWIFTGEIETALKIGGVEFFAKMLIYYLHERFWVFMAPPPSSATGNSTAE